MAPEQLSHDVIDARTDIYSFASVVYEALLGERVSRRAGVSALYDVMFTEPPLISTRMPEVPESVSLAFKSALSKNPADRPRDIERWVDSFVEEFQRVPSVVAGWPRMFPSHGKDAPTAPLSSKTSVATTTVVTPTESGIDTTVKTPNRITKPLQES